MDANNGEIRERILWYTERVNHYREAIKNGSVGMTIYPLEQDYQPITLDQAKFQYTFWFEAMVWYIRTQIDVKEQE